jgi:hypothetical protein
MRRRIAILCGVIMATTARGQAQRVVPLPQPDAVLAHEFSGITAVRELSDGRVLVVDRVERALYVADFGGNVVNRIGSNGSGPREYRQPMSLLAVGGDSTILPDDFNGRWLMLAGTEIAGTIGGDDPVFTGGTRTPNGSDAGGKLVATKAIVAGAVTPGTMPRRDSILLVRVQRATGAQDTLAMLRARPSVIRTEGPSNAPTAVSVVMNPLTSSEQATMYPDGWIAIARLDPYRVEWIAPTGQRVSGPSLPTERVPLDDREQRAYLQREADQSGRPVRDPAGLPDWPAFLPPFLGNALTPATDGTLWIRRTASTRNLRPPYDVVRRNGELAARVATGNDVTVLGFGRGVVYTAFTDENGIQKLQRRPMPRIN